MLRTYIIALMMVAGFAAGVGIAAMLEHMFEWIYFATH